MITVDDCINMLTDAYVKCSVIHNGSVLASSDGTADYTWEEFSRVDRKRVICWEVQSDRLVLYV